MVNSEIPRAEDITSAIEALKGNKRVWQGWIWAIPIGAIVVLAYYLTPYFTQ